MLSSTPQFFPSMPGQSLELTLPLPVSRSVRKPPFAGRLRRPAREPLTLIGGIETLLSPPRQHRPTIIKKSFTHSTKNPKLPEKP